MNVLGHPNQKRTEFTEYIFEVNSLEGKARIQATEVHTRSSERVFKY